LLREQEAARKEERRVWAVNADRAARDRILDYDPKQEGKYYTTLSTTPTSVHSPSTRSVSRSKVPSI
jgi:hypothetical protein